MQVFPELVDVVLHFFAELVEVALFFFAVEIVLAGNESGARRPSRPGQGPLKLLHKNKAPSANRISISFTKDLPEDITHRRNRDARCCTDPRPKNVTAGCSRSIRVLSQQKVRHLAFLLSTDNLADLYRCCGLFEPPLEHGVDGESALL